MHFMHLTIFYDVYMQDLVSRLTLNELVDQMAHGGASNNGNHNYFNKSILIVV